MTLDLLTHISIFFSKTVRLVATSLRLLQSIVSGPRTHTHTHSRTKFDAVWRVEVRERVSQRERERESLNQNRGQLHICSEDRGRRERVRERDEDGREGELERGKRGLAVPAWLHWSPSSLILSLSLSQTHTLSPGQLNQTCDRNLLI